MGGIIQTLRVLTCGATINITLCSARWAWETIHTMFRRELKTMVSRPCK